MVQSRYWSFRAGERGPPRACCSPGPHLWRRIGGSLVSAPVLKTKLHIPPVRSGRVPRPHLVERLVAGLHRKLTLISAPAGFGKTTLLSECVAHSPRRAAWLSLDAGDNDATRFWMYLIAALQTLDGELGETALTMIRSSQPPARETILTGLLNQLAAQPTPLALVLDDFHLITDSQVHSDLIFLLEHLPPQAHVILSGRSDPPWPLARWRARDQLTELRTIDLRFSLNEATSFLNDSMGLDLSVEDVAALDERAEGWIAGLQMAALAMQPMVHRVDVAPMPTGRPGRSPQTVSSFIQTFTGTHRFVLDYLVEEVIGNQTPAMQEFLLRTSILERMTAPLCDELQAQEPASGEPDGAGPSPLSAHSPSQQRLEQLEDANLFVVALDDERRWYRYHHLFGDLLRRRLEQTQPGLALQLHRRASQWYEAHGLLADAINHAFAAGDVEWIDHLVEKNVLSMLDRGDLGSLLRGLDTIPAQEERKRPWISVAWAWALVYSGQAEHALLHVQDATEAIQAARQDPTEQVRIRGHVAAIRGYVTSVAGAWLESQEYSREALAALPESDSTARTFAASQLGIALRMSGQLAAASEALTEAIEISRVAGDSHVAMTVQCHLVNLQRIQGRLHEAADNCRQALELAEEHARRDGLALPITGYVHSWLSGILYEWNQIEEALYHATEGLRLCQEWGWVEALADCHYFVAMARWGAGDLKGALEMLSIAKVMAADLSDWYVGIMESFQARLLLAQGNVPAARQLVAASGCTPDDTVEFSRSFWYRTLARVLIAEGQPEAAVPLLERLLELVEPSGATTITVQTLVVQALVHHAMGEVDAALSSLQRALQLAEPGGFVRLFVEEGPVMADLLQMAHQQGIAVDYAQRLLAAFEDSGHRPQPDSSPSQVRSGAQAGAPLAEPLTEREMDVLRLLPSSLSVPEIAGELFVSPHTVRSHIKSIYGKLDAHSRMEAVGLAQEFGLL